MRLACPSRRLFAALSGAALLTTASAQDAPVRPQPPPDPRRAALQPDSELRVLTIRHVDVMELAQTVQSFAGAMREPAFIAPYPATQRLVLAANSEVVLAKLETLISALDQLPEAELAKELVESVTLGNATAEQLAHALIQLTQLSGRAVRLSIVPDLRTNTLWIYGDGEEVKRCAEIARKMDTLADGATPGGGGGVSRGLTDWRHYPLQHTDAARVSEVINELLKLSSIKARVVADAHSNALVASVPEGVDISSVSELVRLLDVPTASRSAPDKPN